eukprot:805290_1
MEMHDDEEQTRFLTERIQYTYKENQEKKTQENNSHKKGTGYQKSRSHRRNRRRRNGRKNGGAMQKIQGKDDTKIEHCDARDYLDCQSNNQPQSDHMSSGEMCEAENNHKAVQTVLRRHKPRAVDPPPSVKNTNKSKINSKGVKSAAKKMQKKKTKEKKRRKVSDNQKCNDVADHN